MRASTALFFVFPVLVGVWAPGCKSAIRNCDPGETVWECTIPSTTCTTSFPLKECGADLPHAILAANTDAVSKYHLMTAPPGTTCIPTSATWYNEQSDTPTFMPQTLGGSCDPGAEDACTECVKSHCCGDFVACGADTNCSCFVDCLGAGNTLDRCAMTTCGALGAVALATAACASNACPAECGGSTGSGMCGSTSSSSGSGGGGGGGGGPTCTPGPAGSGENCFSDADCISCSCDSQTMTCF